MINIVCSSWLFSQLINNLTYQNKQSSNNESSNNDSSTNNTKRENLNKEFSTKPELDHFSYQDIGNWFVIWEMDRTFCSSIL